ncbi:hypothetical protein GDO81_012247 [Engystomops pustulosus]|uniref:Uncharacterized protein n=1 Tax=Engystomops pustulosus TaxID=76066 RepID=A0AAV7BK77_ENGPU|nr:hypothetical protein GDO81_012247 [Engystomops pustulosus]
MMPDGTELKHLATIKLFCETRLFRILHPPGAGPPSAYTTGLRTLSPSTRWFPAPIQDDVTGWMGCHHYCISRSISHLRSGIKNIFRPIKCILFFPL